MEDKPNLLKLLEEPTEQMSDDQLREHIAKLQAVGKKDIAQIIEDEALGRPEYRGFLYILSNVAMPGLVKVGISSGQPLERAKELSRHTGVPTPFVVECFFPIYEDLRSVESKVHKGLDVFRENSSREFFRLPVEIAELEIQALLRQAPRRMPIT
jgi:hypothetical protein